VTGVDSLECRACTGAHVIVHFVMREDAMAAEQPGERDVEAANTATRRTHAEPRIEIAAHHPEPRAKLREIPGRPAEDPERWDTVVRRARPVVERQHPDERRLAGTVRPEHRGVFTLGDDQRQALEHACPAADERRVS
jgi:hypothetical protein